MEFSFFSGGTGTPKLVEGFRAIGIEDSQINIIANTGDDIYWNGLLVSPDLDTLLYLFAGKLDLEKYWGQQNESFKTLDALKLFDEEGTESWFNIGDKDLALHLFRNYLLKQGLSLTEATQQISSKWGITATILPMSDHKVTTSIISNSRSYHFQEYFVKHRWQLPVLNVEYLGSDVAKIPAIASQKLTSSNMIIIGPSNPITSIGPILALKEYQEYLKSARAKVLLVSPLVGSRAFSGPTVVLMKAKGIEPTALGLAEFYKDYVHTIVLDPKDRDYADSIRDLGVEPVFSATKLSDLQAKQNLANYILEVF